MNEHDKHRAKPATPRPAASPEPTSPLPDDSGEELGRLDDAVIGRAFRVSAFVLLGCAVAAAAILLYARRKPPARATQLTQISAPVVAPRPEVQIPTVKFTDITASAGIRFIHSNGALGEKLLPETMGGGVAFFDFDRDGDQDLFFVNSNYWPGKLPAGQKPPSVALYQNDGSGKFRDVTPGSGLEVPIYGMGVAVGDYDNDGLPDLFISAVGENRLLHNDGQGKFRDVTALAGVAGDPRDWSTASCWVDIDNDGDLDLFVGNYVKWSRDIDFEVGYKIDGVNRAYGPPMNFQGSFPYLYRNDGGGKFTEVSAASGLQVANAATGVPAGKTLGVAPADLNRDGWIDLVVANDTVQNFVFVNQQNGAFKESGALSGVAFDNYGNTRGAMGIDTGFYRNNDTLAIVIGNFANEMTALYTSQRDPLSFADAAIPEGIGPASRLLLKFGVFFIDYDLDGRLDVLTSNGHLEEEINKTQQTQHYLQPAQLFWNSGSDSGATFWNVPTEHAGADLFKPIAGRGSAFADIDDDGDLDVVLTQVNGPPLLLRNDQALAHSWVRLHLVGAKANKDAIGALVQLKLGDKLLRRQVMPARGYLSQSELPVTIGLGKADRIDAIEIIWPGGQRQNVQTAAVPLGKSTTIVQEAPVGMITPQIQDGTVANLSGTPDDSSESSGQAEVRSVIRGSDAEMATHADRHVVAGVSPAVEGRRPAARSNATTLQLGLELTESLFSWSILPSQTHSSNSAAFPTRTHSPNE